MAANLDRLPGISSAYLTGGSLWLQHGMPIDPDPKHGQPSDGGEEGSGQNRRLGNRQRWLSKGELSDEERDRKPDPGQQSNANQLTPVSAGGQPGDSQSGGEPGE
jgi:hypothetical protein